MKFLIDNMLLIAVILISGGALIIPALQRRGAKVSPLEATRLMNQNKCTILDVRNAEEFEAGHIRNAKHIPLSDLSSRIKELEKQKANPVLAVCARGTRSATATTLLVRAGFTNVVSLDGGMTEWQSQGLPVVKN